MKTITIAEPTFFETVQNWTQANPGLAMFAGAALLFVVCLDRDTRRAFLPF